MSASLLPIVVYVTCGRQTAATNPVGVWVANIGSDPSGVAQALWTDGKLRLRKVGSFKIYAPIAGEGRFTTSGKRLHLVFSKILGKEAALWSERVSEQPLLTGLKVDAPLDIIVGSTTLANAPTPQTYAGVKWTRWQPSSISSLLKVISKVDPSDQDSQFAYDEIVERGVNAIPDLTQILDGPANDLELRYWAACMLGDTKRPEAAAPLIQALESYKPPSSGKRAHLVPMGIINALGKLKSKQAVAAIVRHGSTEKSADYNVTKALGDISDPRGVDFLVDQLNKPSLGKSDGLMRGLTIKSLGQIGDPRCLPAVLKYESSRDPQIVAAVSEALPRLEKDTALHAKYGSALIAALPKAEWMTQCDIVEALGDCGDARAIQPLLDVLKAENSAVVRDAAEALGKLKAKRAVPALTELALNPDDGVRAAAAEALQKIRG